MNTMAQWEDETSNRQIQYSIGYSIENATVKVNHVAPTKVSFIDPTTNTATRSIGVHTEKGRKMLADQFAASGKLDEVVVEIAKRNDLLVQAS